LALEADDQWRRTWRRCFFTRRLGRRYERGQKLDLAFRG
jgi:hypothetical protein